MNIYVDIFHYNSYVLRFCMQTSVYSIFDPTVYLLLWMCVTIVNFYILHQFFFVSFNTAHCFSYVYTSCWLYI
jgi:hypothetical protein